MARRKVLVGASTGNAPIYRANLSRASVAGVRASVDRTPFTPGSTPPATEAVESLREALEGSLSTTKEAVREEAWDALLEGDYRRSTRAFEMAVRFDPEDGEARLGELFAHAALGNRRTVAVLVARMNRTDPALFQHEFDVNERLGDRRDVTGVRIEARAAAEASGASADVTASAALLLWYLGDRQDALAAAVRVARGAEGEAYRDWPARMRAAMTPR